MESLSDFIKYMNRHNRHLLREGKKHSIYGDRDNPNIHSPVPRHAALKRGTIRSICKDLQIPDPFKNER